MKTPAAVRALLLGVFFSSSEAIDSLYTLQRRNELHASLFLPAISSTAATYEITFAQPLDHFNVLLSQQQWQQRVWVNEAYYNATLGGPLFLYLEGEAAGSASSVTGGQHVELARVHNALIISIEHRFYGQSLPLPNLTTDSLAFLSHEQALADVAKFLSEYVPGQVRWRNVTRTISFGGSYSGALSAWARVRLPHLIHGAFATSGPVQPVVNFTGYGEVTWEAMGNSLVGGSAACAEAITSAYFGIDAALRGSDAQKTAISQKMHSCAPALSLNDTMWMSSNIANVIMGIVQYNNAASALNVASVCTAMLQPGVAPVDAYANVVQSSLGGSGCMDNNYSAFIAQMRNIVPDPNARGVPLRTWNWQYCSAFAYYQGPYTLFLHLTLMTLESNFQICVDAFGERVAAPVNIEAVAQTNALLGGKRAAVAASRILFVNSGIDGWSAAGVRPGDPVDPSNAVVFMPTQSHCRAMSGSRADDPPEVKKARDDSAAVLATWLAV